MRRQSEIPVTVKNRVIGGKVPLICLPLVAGGKSDLLQQAAELKELSPDLLEWRIDGYGAMEDVDACVEALKALQAAVGSIPLIFTCRIHSEGGFKKASQAARLSLITAAIAAGGVDIVDIEMCNEPSFIESVKNIAKAHGTKLILSYHNFTTTPDTNTLHDKLLQAQVMGGDIAKIAVMPTDYADVLTLLGATLKARTGAVKVPMVTMSMGTEGVLTRVAGGLFGSDITFAMGGCVSAPGQIPIEALRQAMRAFYPS